MKNLVFNFKAILLKIISALIPPMNWRAPVLVLLATICGIGLYILHISKMTSYLSERPEVCMNCHIMAPEYATWSHSSHARFTNCNSCHVPQDNIFNHYFFKAKDGLRHSYMFTFKLEPQVIRIHEAGANVVQANCMKCHAHQLKDTSLAVIHKNTENRRCWECHRDVPHGHVKGLSTVPNAKVPTTGSMVPEWIRRINK